MSLAPEDIRQSTKTQGLGIGLRVCHELLSKHSGSLEIAPGELNGAVTTVRLPACSPPNGATTVSQPFKIPNKATYDDLQVLCVDDEQAVLESLTALLSSLGVRVLTTSSGEAALHKFKTQPCDFVICDLDLPDTDGISVLKQMREMNQHSKLGLLTGWDSHPEELSSDWLPDFQLTKPASLEEISEVLQTTESTRKTSSS